MLLGRFAPCGACVVRVCRERLALSVRQESVDRRAETGSSFSAYLNTAETRGVQLTNVGGLAPCRSSPPFHFGQSSGAKNGASVSDRSGEPRSVVVGWLHVVMCPDLGEAAPDVAEHGGVTPLAPVERQRQAGHGDE